MFNQPSPTPSSAHAGDAASWDKVWFRIGLAALFAGQGMVFGLAVNLSPPEGIAYWILHGGLMGSALLVFALLGGPLLREVWSSVRRARLTIDVLFFVTLSGAFIASLLATFHRTGDVYYEVVAIILAVYTLGKAVIARSRAQVLSETGKLRHSLGQARWLTDSGQSMVVSVSELDAGARVLVPPGEAITVDGWIRRGRGWVDQRMMTGEPDPRLVSPGDEVLAGMVAVDAAFEVEVSHPGGKRRFDQILTLVENAEQQPSRMQLRAEELTKWFLPVVFLCSLGTFLFWWPHSGFARALFNSMAVLLVSCPCALGLATPMAVWGGLMSLLRLGIATRAARLLDALASCRKVVFDKTGTLFGETPGVVSVEWSPRPADQADWWRQCILAMEKDLTHPAARAITNWARETSNPNSVHGPVMRDLQVISGAGIRATVSSAQRSFVLSLGESALANPSAIWPENWRGLAPCEKGNKREVFFFIDGEPAARFCLQESLREDALPTLHRLHGMGLQLDVLTGDGSFQSDLPSFVRVHAGLSPEEKAQRVETWQGEGRGVLYVGDGINDAPAMSRALGSLSLDHGADLARSASDGIILGGRLGGLPEALQVSRRIHSRLRGNFLLAASYNFVGVALAMCGWLHPVVAALLMVGSSLIVSSRALRSARLETIRSVPVAAEDPPRGNVTNPSTGGIRS